MAMRLQKLHQLTDASSYIFEEITDGYSDVELGRDFWKYLRSRSLDCTARKVKVSEYVRKRISSLDERGFERKYGVRLSNIKKSSEQLRFCCSCVSLLLQHSSFGEGIIDWS